MTTASPVLASGTPKALDCAANHITSAAQWKACWDVGWSQPTGSFANAGTAAGHNVLPIVIGIALIVLVLLLVSKSRSRPAATSS